MERRAFTIIVILAGILASPLYADRLTVRPSDLPPEDDCLRAAIVRNPDVLLAGDHFAMAVGLQNGCRHVARVSVDIYLAKENFRVQIGSAYVELEGPQVEIISLRPMVPRRIRAGRYSLVMVSETRAGEIDFDRSSVFVRNGTVDPVRDRPDHIIGDLENDLEPVRPVPLAEEITGKVSRMADGKIRIVSREGWTKTLSIDQRTIIQDENGRPTRVYEGDWVHVEFTGRHADLITVLSH